MQDIFWYLAGHLLFISDINYFLILTLMFYQLCSVLRCIQELALILNTRI